MTALRLEQIEFEYRRLPLFRDLNLQFPGRTVTALLGPSGAGKSTLLRLIAGLEKPRSGRIYIHDQLATLHNRILIPPHRRHLAMVFQDGALWPHMTVYQNITFGLENPRQLRLHRIIRMLQLEPLLDRFPAQISGGQRQLTALARALARKPKILLLDEPLAHVDVTLKQTVLQHIRHINRNEKITVIYVTHNHREAFKIAHHTVILHQGQILAQGSPAHIKNSSHPFVRTFLDF